MHAGKDNATPLYIAGFISYFGGHPLLHTYQYSTAMSLPVCQERLHTPKNNRIAYVQYKELRPQKYHILNSCAQAHVCLSINRSVIFQLATHMNIIPS